MATESLETGVGGVRFVKSENNERTTTVYSGTDTKGIVVTTDTDGITKAYNTASILDSDIGNEIATANWVNKKISKIQYSNIEGIPNLQTVIEETAINPLTVKINNKLDLSGGTVSGTIKSSNSTTLSKSNDTSYFSIYGGNGTGGRFVLFGPEHSSQPNEFQIGSPLSGGGMIWLNGKPDGSLKWGGKSIATENFVTSKITSLGLTSDITKLVGYNNVATKTDVNSKLSLSGGTMTGFINAGTISNFIRSKINIDSTTSSSESAIGVSQIYVYDANNKYFGAVQANRDSNGTNRIRLALRNREDTTTYGLGIKETSSKTIAGFCPTPPQTSYTNDIATTEWVLNYAVPVGFTYVQFPGTKTPEEMGMKGTWTNITANYAGLFFRAEGGNAGAFNSSAQTAGLPNITGGVYNIAQQSSGQPITADGAFTSSRSGQVSYGSGSDDVSSRRDSFTFSAKNSNSIYGSANEVRPVNKTIRIWQKTSY